MEKMLKVVAVLCVTAGTSAGAGASVLENFGSKSVNVEYWSGAGANKAMTVVDFGAGGSYAFGYRWDGNATSWNMLQAIDSAGAFGMTYTWWESMQAHAIDSMSYNGSTAVSDWSTSFLGFWGSSDGTTWTAQDTGADGRVLTNMTWDGWSIEDPTVSFVPLNPPRTPVPEPATMGLLLVAAAGLLRRRSGT